MDVSSTIAGFEATDDVEVLKTLMHRAIQNYGFDSFNFLDVGDVREDVPFYFGTVAKGYEAAYRDNQFVVIDPYVRKAQMSSRPFTWGNLPVDPPRLGGPKSRLTRLFEAVNDFGFREGIVIPFHFSDPLGRPCSALIVLMWTGSRVDFAKITREKELDLYLVAHYWAHRMIDLLAEQFRDRTAPFRFIREQKRFKITDRERDVLQWAARGKSAAATAEILGLAESTVEGYLKNALKSLQAVNKVHALSMAVAARIIDPP